MPDEPDYRSPDSIDPNELRGALSSLCLLGDDLYLRMQVTNVGLVDHYIMGLEYHVLRKLLEEEKTPAETAFLGAQSQMWIFAVYELMRTWRQRAREVVRLHQSGKLATKIEALEEGLGYRHIGRELRARQLRDVLADPSALDRLQSDLRRSHIPFRRVEFIRVTLAKHEISKQKDSIAFAPGYGRINHWCGSLDYQMEKGALILDYISRRDIADELRAMVQGDPPTDDDLARFDAVMNTDPKTLDWNG